MILNTIVKFLLSIVLLALSAASLAQTYTYKCPPSNKVHHFLDTAFGVISKYKNGVFDSIKFATGPARMGRNAKVGNHSGVMVALGSGSHQMQCLYGFKSLIEWSRKACPPPYPTFAKGL